MKVFLVFLSLLLVSVTFIAYQGDLARYLQIQEYLKGLAEECAAGAAMYYEEDHFGQGVMVLSAAEAETFVEYMAEQGNGVLGESREGFLSYELELFDAVKGFDSAGEFPAAQVTLCYTCEDLFRLPFLRVTEVSRQGRYELREF